MLTSQKLFLENNLYRFYDDFIGFEDYIVRKCGQYNYISSLKYQWPGFVYNIESDLESCDQLIKDLEKKVSSNEIPPFLLVDPQRVPLIFEEMLDQIGIRKIDYWPIIVLDLMKNKFQLKNLPDFTIVEIHDEKQLRLWYNIVVSVLFPNKSVPFEFFRQRLNDERYLFHIGYCDFKPATSFMVFMDKQIAGTYMGATLNDFRKRGFGSEIMIKALFDAQQAGCLYATGQSSRMGFPVWQQLGFTSNNTIDIYWMIGTQHK